MKCLDFDKKFQLYLSKWMKEHESEYHNYDELEARIADVYEGFLDTPADWLSGVKPGEYFEQFSDAKQLVDWMEDYEKQRVPVPDMLLNRISGLGEKSEAPLMNLLGKERAPQSAKMSAVTLLREIESEKPMDLYIGWIVASNGRDELCDNALESLESLGERAADGMRAALFDATDEGKVSLLSLLCDLRRDEQVLDAALDLFARKADAAAVLADVLARLGDERALPALKKAAASEDTGYLDYIELRSAIEALGGEAPERVFDEEDPAYTAMRGIEEHMVSKALGNEAHDHDCGDGCAHH